MRFNIIGVLADNNCYLFDMQTGYVPRQNEEIEFNGIVYVVKYVRYKMTAGSYIAQNVQLGLYYK